MAESFWLFSFRCINIFIKNEKGLTYLEITYKNRVLSTQISVNIKKFENDIIEAKDYEKNDIEKKIVSLYKENKTYP